MHFLLWTKGFHENTNFDIFKCSDENLPNSSCPFPNHKSVFLQISHDSYNSSVLFSFKHYILCTNGTNQSKYKFFRLFSARIKIHQVLVIFEKKKQVFIKILHYSLISWDITPPYFIYLKLYILSAKVACQSTSLVKFHLSSWKSEILHYGGLLL